MSEAEALLSRSLGPLAPRVREFVSFYSRLWRESPCQPLPLKRRFGRSQKKEIEKELTSLVERAGEEQKTLPPETGLPQPERLEAFASSLEPILKRILDRLELPLHSIFDKRFLDATQAFIQASRRFDPELRIDQVYQALRNVWIMNTLQFYLGIEVEHTEAVFGYSLVYPYLDNLLDDGAIAQSRKLEFMTKIRSWLEGETAPARTPREEKLLALIRKIETRFTRSDYPGVYQSMLSIFNGQIKSLLQQRDKTTVDEENILAISMEKGGTSVLADGYLVAGRLSPDQEDFCFGFGAFLQLADDLQDIEEDAERKHITLFSQQAGRKPLDSQVYKLYWFMSRVLEKTLKADRPREKAMQDVIQRSCALMYLESMGKSPRYFSRRCVRNSQKAFPVRYTYLAKLRRSVQERFMTGRETISDLDPVSTAMLTLSSRALALE